MFALSLVAKTNVGNRSVTYGVGDATYQAAGGESGIRQLVDHFYDIMAQDHPRIFNWHPEDNEASRDKLASFLCGWMGGPRRYHEKYGPISIPGVHAHLAVDAAARDEWLACMSKALTKMGYPEEFKDYLLTQLAVPAEYIRQATEANLSQ